MSGGMYIVVSAERCMNIFFFFQAEDGIRDGRVTGVQTCALPIWGISPESAKQMGYHRELEVACETLKKMHRRGIRILPGGDYGFAWIKHGTNAKDLEYFVAYLGFTPMESLLAATKLGGQIMMRGDELGQIKEGHLADLVLVEGDPLADIAVLQDGARLLGVMKDGVFHKDPQK